MTYAIACLLEGPVAEYQRRLIQEIADQTGLRFTLTQAIPPHFTLKYPFETEEGDAIESLVERFCRERARTPVTVGGFDQFPPDVVFLDVRLSPAAQAVFHELLRELRGLPWMTWGPYDGENLRFHATLAERCGSNLPEVRDYLRGREECFDCWYDNLTLFVQTGVVDGISRWAVFRRFGIG